MSQKQLDLGPEFKKISQPSRQNKKIQRIIRPIPTISGNQLDLSPEFKKLRIFYDLIAAGNCCQNTEYENKPNKGFRVKYGKPKKPLRVASLFSGIGAFEQALKMLNIQFELAFAGDIDKNVRLAYFANHPKHIHKDNWHTDVIDFAASGAAKKFRNKIDLLVGGPPCQTFSAIGKQEGLNDERGNLIYQFTEVLEQCAPKIFIFENVTAFRSIDNGKVWVEFMKKLNKLGYDSENTYWNIMNAKDYGIPQSRKRIFIIGFKKKEIDYKFPMSWECKQNLQGLLETKDVDSKYFLTKKGVQFVTKQKNLESHRTQVTKEKSGNITNAICQTARQQQNWHGDFVEVSYEDYIKRYELSDKVQKFVMQAGSKNFHVKPETDKKIANALLSTLHKMHRAGIDNYISMSDERKIRRLTPRECLNLMGWVDKKYKPIAFKREHEGEFISDTEVYKQAGNSIVVWLAAQIISTIRFDRLGLSE